MFPVNKTPYSYIMAHKQSWETQEQYKCEKQCFGTKYTIVWRNEKYWSRFGIYKNQSKMLVPFHVIMIVFTKAVCQLLKKASLHGDSYMDNRIFVLWHLGLLLGNDRKTNK
jgi:hypothetical protein